MKYMIVTVESFQSGDIPEEVAKFISVHDDPFIVLDESSKIKSNKAVAKRNKSKRCQAIQKLNTIGSRAILTGTFISKSPVNAYDQMEFLKKDYWEEDIFSFENRYCIMIRLPIGRGIRVLIPEDTYYSLHRSLVKAEKNGMLQAQIGSSSRYYSLSERKLLHILKNKEYTPFIGVKDIYDRISKDTIIVKKKDALNIPDKVYKKIRLSMNSEMEKLYKQLLDVGFTDEYISRGNGISLYHRFQDIVNGYIPVQKDGDEAVVLERQKDNAKISALLDEISSIDIDNHQVVVWSNRKLFIRDIYNALSKEDISCCVYDGDTSTDEKERIKDDFSSGKVRVFIGNQRSGSFGLDWLKSADYAIFISNDYSVETREQAEDRIHRGGIKDVSKTIIDIVVAGTVDEKVQESLRVGKELIHSGVTDKSVFALYNVVW